MDQSAKGHRGGRVQPRAILSRVLLWLSAGVLIGFLAGLAHALGVIAANEYLGYGLGRLAVHALRTSLDRWLLGVLQLAFFLGLIDAALRLVGRRVRSTLVEVHIIDGNGAVGYLLSVVAGLTIFLWGGYWWFTRRLPPMHHFQDFLRSFHDHVEYNFKITNLPEGLVLLAASFLAIVLLGWLLTRCRLATLTCRATSILGSSRGLFVSAVFLLVFGAVVICDHWVTMTDASQRPNVILITIDTLRPDHLGCYGYERKTSPFLDSLAKESVLFMRAFTPWPTTTPAIAALMTGRYPHSVGITRISPYQHFEDQLVLLAELLRNQGYYTEAVVSNGHVGKTANADQGFEVFAETGGPARQTNQLASRALRRLDRAVTRGRPFFLWLHYLDPHVPYKPPRYRGLFLGDPFYDAGSMIPVGDEPGERIPTASGDARLSHYERQRRAEINEQNLGSAPSRLVDERTEELAHYVAMYDAEIRYLDEYLQALFSELRGKGLLNHSAVVLTADHGESLGEHDYYFCQGRFPYNTTLRVPLLINDSSRGAKEVSSLASLLDVTPTILDLVGIESPSNLDGRTLLPVIDGEELEPRDLFAEAGYAIEYQKILVRDDWKLVYVPDSLDRSLMRGDEFELYNLAEDPMEATDLSNKCPEIVEEMKPSLLAWINSWRGRELTPAKPNLQYSEEELENLRALGYIK